MITFHRAAARHLATALVLSLAMILGQARADTPSRVRIDNFAFVPAELTVPPGTTVTFENGDDIPHLVVADDHSFRSKALDTGDSFSVTFAKPGAFPYFCGLHPHMQGRITVTP